MVASSHTRPRLLHFSPEDISQVIYTLISTTVVLVGITQNTPFAIAATLLGKTLALTLAHGYAESVAHQQSLWAASLHARPVLLTSTPSIATAFLFGLIGLDGETVLYTSAGINLAGLVTLQTIATRRVGFTWARLTAAAFLDLVAVLTVVTMVLLLK